MTDAGPLMCAGEINMEKEGIKKVLEASLAARSVSSLIMMLILETCLIHFNVPVKETLADDS